VLNLLKDLQQRLGLTYIFISHDLAVVKHIADRVAVMYLGRIVESARADRLFAAPRHPYTRALISAIPVPQPRRNHHRPILTGDVPSALAPPPGCHLHTRCPHAIDLCRTVRPELVADPTGHATACHRWTELPDEPGLHVRDAPPPTLERLIAAFARPRDVSGRAGVGVNKNGL
jgi:peptide/nickel transport system ATP-binding protein/oligopeptide transport system ATP-binding protein